MTDDPSTDYSQTERKPHRARTRKELYLAVEIEGANMWDKAMSKAELAKREYWDRIAVQVVGSFAGVFFGSAFGVLIVSLAGLVS